MSANHLTKPQAICLSQQIALLSHCTATFAKVLGQNFCKSSAGNHYLATSNSHKPVTKDIVAGLSRPRALTKMVDVFLHHYDTPDSTSTSLDIYVLLVRKRRPPKMQISIFL